MRKARFAAALATTTLLLAIPTAGQATPGAATHVDSVTATAGSSTIAVSGTATFVDVPVTVGEDGSGDAAVPGIGADLTTAKIERPVGTNQLKFTLGIADQPPAAFGVPNIVYNWGVSADGEDLGLTLGASRIWGGTAPSPNPTFKLLSLADQMFSEVANLSGVMAGGIVQWTASLSQVKAVNGGILSVGAQGIEATAGVGGTVFFNGGLGGDTGFAEDYTVPFASVKLGIATAGTPAEEVPLTVALSGATNPNPTTGAFSGALPKPLAGSGTHIVVAQACYSPTVCGTASTTITV